MDYRDQLVLERTAATNRVHAEMLGLGPGYQAKIPALALKWQVAAVLELLDGDHSVRATLCRHRLERVQQIDTQVTDLTKQIAAAVRTSGSTLTGCRSAETASFCTALRVEMPPFIEGMRR